jgi:hypothetical protein
VYQQSEKAAMVRAPKALSAPASVGQRSDLMFSRAHLWLFPIRHLTRS